MYRLGLVSALFSMPANSGGCTTERPRLNGKNFNAVTPTNVSNEIASAAPAERLGAANDRHSRALKRLSGTEMRMPKMMP